MDAYVHLYLYLRWFAVVYVVYYAYNGNAYVYTPGPGAYPNTFDKVLNSRRASSSSAFTFWGLYATTFAVGFVNLTGWRYIYIHSRYLCMFVGYVYGGWVLASDNAFPSEWQRKERKKK